MCPTQMNTSDNPGLWDIQFSSWVFCEFNAIVKSLFKLASSWFQGSSYDVRVELLLASAADFRSLCSSDQRRFGRLLVRETPHMRAHCTLSLWQAIFTDRQTAIYYRYSFPTRGNGTGHTQRDSCDDECRIQLPGYDFSVIQSFQHLTLISEAS